MWWGAVLPLFQDQVRTASHSWWFILLKPYSFIALFNIYATIATISYFSPRITFKFDHLGSRKSCISTYNSAVRGICDRGEFHDRLFVEPDIVKCNLVISNAWLAWSDLQFEVYVYCRYIMICSRWRYNHRKDDPIRDGGLWQHNALDAPFASDQFINLIINPLNMEVYLIGLYPKMVRSKRKNSNDLR